jgi:hypothetical protein
VIQQIAGACPDANYNWPVKLPNNLPSCERCTFAWSWVNAIGNREFYMNCADVRIVGGPGRTIRGSGIFLANLPGYSKYQPSARDGGPGASQTTHLQVRVQ